MEQTRIQKIVLFLTLSLIFGLFSIIPWYVNLHKQDDFNRSIKIKEVKLSEKTKLKIDHAQSEKYFLYKNYLVIKNKSLIPFVYKKDSIVKNVRYVYSD